ncbi:histidine phosphatase family protein [Aminobacter carboxidus]|uniref:Histidine phosphatase family protein n=1 Tax=Aminobacter carboxidus TaxID=376165 RepID=A0ABR9GNL2_9HYPH|nr:histidine phosphatase family protein [Aminobacter carboxidus]MBE1205252.1 histidine phosphatase family protein [Aminobacter carboxidus]
MPFHFPDMLVIRHGETQWNVAGRLQGHKDTPLTANGVRRTLDVGAYLAARVAACQGARFWVSPLGRARQTASILADVWGVQFDRFVDQTSLVERAFGVWEGRSYDEIERVFPEQFLADRANPWSYAMPSGESHVELMARMRSWLVGLDRSIPHVVVAHSVSLRALRGVYTGAAPQDILGYCEPQTAAYWLSGGRETLLDALAERAISVAG